MGLHRIDRCAIEGFDSQMLFDPLEKQFDLPTALVIGDPVNEPFVLQQDFDAIQVLLVNATIAKRSHRFVIGSSELSVKLAVIGAFRLPTPV